MDWSGELQGGIKKQHINLLIDLPRLPDADINSSRRYKTAEVFIIYRNRKLRGERRKT